LRPVASLPLSPGKTKKEKGKKENYDEQSSNKQLKICSKHNFKKKRKKTTESQRNCGLGGGRYLALCILDNVSLVQHAIVPSNVRKPCSILSDRVITAQIHTQNLVFYQLVARLKIQTNESTKSKKKVEILCNETDRSFQPNNNDVVRF
jgi:hypothetical protein